LHPGRPPLGEVLQRGNQQRRQVAPGGLPQERGRLLQREAQVGRAQLGELAAGAQPRQRQRRTARLASTSRSPGGSRSSRNVTLSCTGDASIR
jgi:hypothetical protein